MFTRTSRRIWCLAGALPALGACGQTNGAHTPGAGGLKVIGGGIPCAYADSATLSPDCSVDRTPGPEGLVLTIRHPDGGFHRLRVTRDGHGLVAADGAEPAQVTVVGPHEIEVALGGARYRLPATVGSMPQATP